MNKPFLRNIHDFYNAFISVKTFHCRGITTGFSVFSSGIMILLNIIKFFYFQLMSICIEGFLQGILGCSSSMFKFLKISARSAATFAEKHLGRATFTQIYATLIIYEGKLFSCKKSLYVYFDFYIQNKNCIYSLIKL